MADSHLRVSVLRRQPVLALLPIPIALLALALTFLVAGTDTPRQIAPGSSLAGTGLLVTVVIAATLTLLVRAAGADGQMQKLGMVLTLLTSLIAWPMWTMGALPSLNGVRLAPTATAAMTLERLETSHASKSRTIYHWAYLTTTDASTPVRSGRYFVSDGAYARWSADGTRTVQLTYARGLLGAQVVLGIR